MKTQVLLKKVRGQKRGSAVTQVFLAKQLNRNQTYFLIGGELQYTKTEICLLIRNNHTIDLFLTNTGRIFLVYVSGKDIIFWIKIKNVKDMPSPSQDSKI